jgi:hypothetical protein
MSKIKIGDEATSETMLRPGGMVVVAGRRHSARSLTGYIEPGVQLVITGGGNQGFEVLPADQVADRSALPGFGRVVYSTYGDRIRAEHRGDARADAAAKRARTLRMRALGALFGLASGVVAASLALGTPDHWVTVLQWRDTLVGAGLFVLIGGLGLPLLDDTLDDLDSTFAQFTGLIGLMSLGGFGTLLGWLTPKHGFPMALTAASICGVLLLIPVPGLLMLVGASETAEGTEPLAPGENSGPTESRFSS